MISRHKVDSSRKLWKACSLPYEVGARFSPLKAGAGISPHLGVLPYYKSIKVSERVGIRIESSKIDNTDRLYMALG